MQLEEEENPSEPCALPGDAFTVSLQSACPGVQPASPCAPGDRSAPAASAAAAAAGSGRGTRAEGERERTARERREGRKRVITRGRRGPARLQSGRCAAQHRSWASTRALELFLGLYPAIGSLECPRGKAMRRPSCRGERRAQGDPSSPEFGLCCVKEIGLGEGEGREAASRGMGPQAPQSASPDDWPGPGGRQV